MLRILYRSDKLSINLFNTLSIFSEELEEFQWQEHSTVKTPSWDISNCSISATILPLSSDLENAAIIFYGFFVTFTFED